MCTKLATAQPLNAGHPIEEMMDAGDVRYFEWFSPLYDLFMPAADSTRFERGFELADRPIERILDVGGGTGRAVRSVGAPERLVADPAAGMLSQAREHGLEVVRAEGARLPFDDASVDAVLVVDALHHISDQLGVLTEAYRILRPGGVIIVSEFDPSTLRGRLLVAGERLVGFDSTFHTPATLRDAMARSGFDATITEQGFGYTVVGRKLEGHHGTAE